jgi:hypothetical protein
MRSGLVRGLPMPTTAGRRLLWWALLMVLTLGFGTSGVQATPFGFVVND